MPLPTSTSSTHQAPSRRRRPSASSGPWRRARVRPPQGGRSSRRRALRGASTSLPASAAGRGERRRRRSRPGRLSWFGCLEASTGRAAMSHELPPRRTAVALGGDARGVFRARSLAAPRRGSDSNWAIAAQEGRPIYRTQGHTHAEAPAVVAELRCCRHRRAPLASAASGCGRCLSVYPRRARRCPGAARGAVALGRRVAARPRLGRPGLS
mmetsp:Transcript_83609/g.241459  ORF Transcript_83609/g.241459 Transcript_83609/m.241459 type:complete len:211 (-) Transcript_83609:42-674(-)